MKVSNEDNIFIFGWTIPLSSLIENIEHVLGQLKIKGKIYSSALLCTVGVYFMGNSDD